MMINSEWSLQLKLFVNQTLYQNGENNESPKKPTSSFKQNQQESQNEKENLNSTNQLFTEEPKKVAQSCHSQFTLGYELDKKQRRKMKAKHRRAEQYELSSWDPKADYPYKLKG